MLGCMTYGTVVCGITGPKGSLLNQDWVATVLFTNIYPIWILVHNEYCLFDQHWLIYLRKENSHLDWDFGSQRVGLSYLWCQWAPCTPRSLPVPLELDSLFTSLPFFSFHNNSCHITFTEHVISLYRNSSGSPIYLMLKGFQIQHPLIFPTLFLIFPIIHYSLQPTRLHFSLVEGWFSFYLFPCLFITYP